MGNIREVLAANLKEYRRRSGFSQDRLAELADISSQYLATVETCRKFPTPEVLERLAAALDIETHLLFEVATTPEEALSVLRQDILDEMTQLTANMERVVTEAVKLAIAETAKDNPHGDHGPKMA